ncbi:orotidine 5'-phosphate decarboxylase / HUMPS family protein [Streptomyces sp. NPDC001970]
MLGLSPLIATPGVTLPGESPTEHARPGTPRAAIAAGASHAVVGRSVTRAADPVTAVRLVCADLAPRSGVLSAHPEAAGGQGRRGSASHPPPLGGPSP